MEAKSATGHPVGVVADTVVAITLDDVRDNQWQGRLCDPRLNLETALFLAVRTRLSSVLINAQFPLLCQIRPGIHGICSTSTAQPPAPLLPLSIIPAVLPWSLDRHYFAIDMTHPAARAMLAAECCTIEVSRTLGDVDVALFAIAR